jgi:hypothetical protein
MADKFGSGKSSNKATASLNQGLTNKAAKFPDKSMGMKGGKSVDADATRSATAPTPRSLGPRTA